MGANRELKGKGDFSSTGTMSCENIGVGGYQIDGIHCFGKTPV